MYQNGMITQQFYAEATLVPHDYLISQCTEFIVDRVYSVLTEKYSRCATLEYHTLCTFTKLAI
jgi:hypothetical protein